MLFTKLEWVSSFIWALQAAVSRVFLLVFLFKCFNQRWKKNDIIVIYRYRYHCFWTIALNVYSHPVHTCFCRATWHRTDTSTWSELRWSCRLWALLRTTSSRNAKRMRWFSQLSLLRFSLLDLRWRRGNVRVFLLFMNLFYCSRCHLLSLGKL